MAKKAKKNDGGEVLPVMDTATMCGFYDDCIPVHELEDIKAEGRTHRNEFLTPEDVVFTGEDIWVLQRLEKLADADDQFFCDDAEDVVVPTVGADMVTVQGMSLLEYLTMCPIEVDMESKADGVSIKRYAQSMLHGRIYPVIKDGFVSEHDDGEIVSQSSRHGAGMMKGLSNHHVRRDDRIIRRCCSGSRPAQTPRYKDISRETHRSFDNFLRTDE